MFIEDTDPDSGNPKNTEPGSGSATLEKRKKLPKQLREGMGGRIRVKEGLVKRRIFPLNMRSIDNKIC